MTNKPFFNQPLFDHTGTQSILLAICILRVSFTAVAARVAATRSQRESVQRQHVRLRGERLETTSRFTLFILEGEM